MLWENTFPQFLHNCPVTTSPLGVVCILWRRYILTSIEPWAWYYISVERQGTLKNKQDGTKQKGKAMNVWEKLNRLADYLNEDALLSELAIFPSRNLRMP